MTKKWQNSNSPLLDVLDKLMPEKKGTTDQASQTRPVPPITNPQGKTKFRTDKPAYSQYSKQEKKLIGKIYAVISNAISEELFREALINKIEEELTR